MAKIKRIWTDGLSNPKTAKNPYGGGRVAGRDYSYLYQYHGIEREQHLAWVRMKAQCKFRQELFELTWQEFQQIWANKWHLRGRGIHDLCLRRLDEAKSWSVANCEIINRLEHFRSQQLLSRKRKSKRPDNED